MTITFVDARSIPQRDVRSKKWQQTIRCRLCLVRGTWLEVAGLQKKRCLVEGPLGLDRTAEFQKKKSGKSKDLTVSSKESCNRSSEKPTTTERQRERGGEEGETSSEHRGETIVGPARVEGLKIAHPKGDTAASNKSILIINAKEKAVSRAAGGGVKKKDTVKAV